MGLFYREIRIMFGGHFEKNSHKAAILTFLNGLFDLFMLDNI